MSKEVIVESFELDHTIVKAPYVRLIGEETGPKGDIISNYDKLEEKGRQSLLQYSDILLEASYQADSYDIVATMVDSSMQPLYQTEERLMVTFGYDFKNGEIYLLEYEKDVLIRKVFYNEYNISLVPLNENYPIIKITFPIDKHFKIIGKIIGKITH